MGYANAQRTLDYIRIFAEFISQPQYRDVVTMFGILNEPDGTDIGQDVLSSLYVLLLLVVIPRLTHVLSYYQAYQIVREASGTGEGNGPFVAFHDGFFTRAQWAGFLPGADRIALDDHPYICFGSQSSAPMSSYATTPCTDWGSLVNTSMGAFGMTAAGEFSNAVTDCGLWVNGVGQGTRYEGNWTGGSSPSQGSCTPWTDYQNYDQPTKDAIMTFAMASMDALQVGAHRLCFIPADKHVAELVLLDMEDRSVQRYRTDRVSSMVLFARPPRRVDASRSPSSCRSM